MRKSLEDFGRFSDPALLILTSLTDGAKHGYAMIEDIERYSGTRLEPGTLYGAITRLEERGWITPLEIEARRQPYTITDAGLKVLGQQLTTIRKIVGTALQRLPDL
jgi:DNA-binding PadR family transcriptional regulator